MTSPNDEERPLLVTPARICNFYDTDAIYFCYDGRVVEISIAICLHYLVVVGGGKVKGSVHRVSFALS
jgi:hypothetical protein